MYRNAMSTTTAPSAIHGNPALSEPACSTISSERLAATTSSTPAAKLTKKWRLRSMRGPTPRHVMSLPESETSITSADAPRTVANIPHMIYASRRSTIHLPTVIIAPMKMLYKLRNVQHGFRGLYRVWSTEVQFPFQVLILVALLCLAAYVQLPPIEFAILLIAAFLALASEVANTALERLCDRLEPGHDERIAEIKDMSQAFVYVASIPVVVIVVLFIAPRLL